MSDQLGGKEWIDIVIQPKYLFASDSRFIKRSSFEMWWEINVCLLYSMCTFLYGSELKSSILNRLPEFSVFLKEVAV